MYIYTILTPTFLVPQQQPRACLRAAEESTVERLTQSFEDLKCQNICGLGEKVEAMNVLGPRRGGLPV
jgi:hypothetical protein